MEVPDSNSTLYLFSTLSDADIFVYDFGSPADVSAIKDNFSTVYQMLKEIVDYGWPLTIESNGLKGLIKPPTVMFKA
eukprot:14608909-Ditylum_brightwellii.AAC.1